MVQSMTGFGSGERDGFRVEIRSLNHRYLEVSMKVPPELSGHEPPLREILKKNFSRGKLDVHVSVSPSVADIRLDINQSALRSVYGALEKVQKELGIEGKLNMDALLGFKGLFIKEEIAFDAGPLYGAFEDAVRGLHEMRAREGEAIAAELLSMTSEIDAMNGEISTLSAAHMEACKVKYAGRLKELLPGHEDSRLLQEASYLAEKADITEEVARIKSHTGHFRKILSEGGPVGRKLDFLLQELNREANTIASKAEDARVSSIVIDMKAGIEKAREQVQNVQ